MGCVARCIGIMGGAVPVKGAWVGVWGSHNLHTSEQTSPKSTHTHFHSPYPGSPSYNVSWVRAHLLFKAQPRTGHSLVSAL